MSVEIVNFPNIGFLKINLTDEQIAPILQEALEIKENFSSAEKANQGLVGNIKKEYSLLKSRSHIESLLKDYVQTYEDHFKYLQQI
jgi:DNA-binding ferritin-like protein (Dps family)